MVEKHPTTPLSEEEALVEISKDPRLPGLPIKLKARIANQLSALLRHVAATPAEGWGSIGRAERKLTRERLQQRLRFDPEDGQFYWRNGHRCGLVAGHRAEERGKAYIRIRVDGELIMAHILVWLLVHGQYPDFEIDHVNGNGMDNRPGNLVRSNRLLNNSNTRKRSDAKEHKNITPLGSKFQVTVKYAKKIFTVGGVPDIPTAAVIRDKLESYVPRSEAHSKLETFAKLEYLENEGKLT